ncbi:hypothetical protein GSI_06377 [Ganoderma sinense ZZ0214-1]|uniref:Transporter n=1 Tax=Ganoderma sinense ZZ0214-1 TaxID=1077348 RepID=A0A2G8SD26_9APHY|nr:hypothetical protein GSI_06377 [Ganoderma sinense ZZ0214-1]
MLKFLAILATSAAILSSVAVQGATLDKRACPTPDQTKPVCQTSGGSPTMDDCAAALKKLSGPCHQYNNVGSYCTSMVTVGTCKIDVCGYPGAQLDSGVNCGGYLQTILNDCSSGGKVGGYLEPASCNVAYKDQPYRLQFSHS